MGPIFQDGDVTMLLIMAGVMAAVIFGAGACTGCVFGG